MQEKRLECLMVLKIHRSDTPGIDAVINRFATSVRCTVIHFTRPFLATSIFNSGYAYADFAIGL